MLVDTRIIGGIPSRHVLEFLCRQPFRSRGKQSKEWWSELRFDLGLGLTGSEAASDRLASEMVASGWIEPAGSAGRIRRFRLTDAGRCCGLDPFLRNDFLAQSLIRPAPPIAERLACVLHLHTELTRLRLTSHLLTVAQQTLLADLERGFDEVALAQIHDWARCNGDASPFRSSAVPHLAVPRSNLPRIDVALWFPGCLAVAWRPSGIEHSRLGLDYVGQRGVVGQHPSVCGTAAGGDLLIIDEVWRAARQFSSDHAWKTPTSTMVDAILLQATAAMVRELKWRLTHSFEVRMSGDIFMEWEPVEAKHWPGGHWEVPACWTIEDVEEERGGVFSQLNSERYPMGL